jgi:AMMECR1 domain-containing protein
MSDVKDIEYSFLATLQSLDEYFKDMRLAIEDFQKQNIINLNADMLSNFEKTLNLFKQKINKIKEDDDFCFVKVSPEELVAWTDKYNMLARFKVNFNKKESEIKAIDITTDGFFVLSIEVGEKFLPKFSIEFCSQTCLEKLLKNSQNT